MMADDRTDIASLGLNVDASSVDKANASLGAFEKGAHGAAAGAEEYGRATDRMSRQMDQMLRNQQETNRLLMQNITITRQAGDAAQAHARHMTELTVAAGAAGAAYELWGRKAQDTTNKVAQANEQIIASNQRLAASFDAVLQRFTQMSQMQTGGGGFFSPRINTWSGPQFIGQQPLGGAIPYANFPWAMPGIGAGAPMMSRMNQMDPGGTMMRGLLQEAIRSALPPGALLQGANTGAVLGVGNEAGTRMVAQVSQDMRGFSEQAIGAQKVFRDLGITTKDANTALLQLIVNLSKLQAGPRQTALLQAALPGVDPSMINDPVALGRLMRSMEPGTYRNVQSQGANMTAQMQGLVASQEQRIRAMEEANHETMIRHGTNPEIFNEGLYEARRAAQEQERRVTDTNFSKETWGQILSETGKNFVQGVRTTAAYYGIGRGPSEKNFTALPPETEKPRGPVTEEEMSRVAQFAMLGGRQSPVSLKSKLTKAEDEAATLVEKGMIEQEEANRVLRSLRERTLRAINPMEEYAENIAGENAILRLAPEARPEAQAALAARKRADVLAPGDVQARDQAEREARDDARQKVYDQQNGPGGIMDRFTAAIDQAAQISNMPIAQQGYAQFEFGLRQKLNVNGAVTPPELTPEQESQARRDFATQAGGELSKFTQHLTDQTQDTKELAEAYSLGSEAVTRAKAAEEAHTLALQHNWDAVQQATVASDLFTKSLADMGLAAQELLKTGQLEVTSSGRTAAAAAQGPRALQQAAIQNQADAKFKDDARDAAIVAADRAKYVAELEAKQANENAAKAAERARLDRIHAAEYGNAAVPTVSSHMIGPQSNAAGEDVRNANNLIFRRPNVDATQAQIDTEMSTMMSAAGQHLAKGCAELVNKALVAAGLPPSGNNLASSFKNYGRSVAPGNVQRGDIFYAGSSGWGDTGHVGMATGPVGGIAGQVLAAPLPQGTQPPGGTQIFMPPNTRMNIAATPLGTTIDEMGTGAGGGTNPNLKPYLAPARAQIESAGGYVPEAGSPEQTAVARKLAGQASDLELDQIRERTRTTADLVENEKALTAAIAQGPEQEKAARAQIQASTETRKARETAEASGSTQAVANVDALTAAMAKLKLEVDKQTDAQRAAHVVREFQQKQEATGRETSALQSGGLQGFELQTATENYAKQLNPDNPGDAATQAQAAQMAATAKSAEDYQKAILDASNELKTDADSVIKDLASGLVNAATHAGKFKDNLRDVGREISQIGVNAFVTKPLQTLADNAMSGRGFNFNVGSSGLSTTGALGQAIAGGIGKSLGMGGGSDNAGGTIPSANSSTWSDGFMSGLGKFGSAMIGGGNSIVGGWLGLPSSPNAPTVGGNQATAGGNQAIADFGQYMEQTQPYDDGGDVVRGIPAPEVGPDNVHAILQTGEHVLDREETAAYKAVLNKSGLPDLNAFLKYGNPAYRNEGPPSMWDETKGSFPLMNTPPAMILSNSVIPEEDATRTIIKEGEARGWSISPFNPANWPKFDDGGDIASGADQWSVGISSAPSVASAPSAWAPGDTSNSAETTGWSDVGLATAPVVASTPSGGQLSGGTAETTGWSSVGLSTSDWTGGSFAQGGYDPSQSFAANALNPAGLARATSMVAPTGLGGEITSLGSAAADWAGFDVKNLPEATPSPGAPPLVNYGAQRTAAASRGFAEQAAPDVSKYATIPSSTPGAPPLVNYSDFTGNTPKFDDGGDVTGAGTAAATLQSADQSPDQAILGPELQGGTTSGVHIPPQKPGNSLLETVFKMVTGAAGKLLGGASGGGSMITNLTGGGAGYSGSGASGGYYNSGGGGDTSASGDFGGGGDEAVGGYSAGGGDMNFGGFSGYSAQAGGDMVGFGQRTRYVPNSVFWGAPRYETGGLLPDEVPIIAHTGERVLNREETKVYGANQGGRMVGDVHIVQNIHTPNAESFRQTAGQTMAATRTAAERAQRQA